MGRLISDLLDFARSQHGAIPIKPENCELREIAADVISEIKLAQPSRDIRVEAQDGCDGHWDRARLAQVFQNLLGNAIEHGAPDAPVTVLTGCDRTHVWAKVTNRGAIPPEERRRIFEPFRSSAKSRGLGLGLYIARAIVQAHGGTIAVDSREDETTFVITMPLHARAHPEESQPRA
jgi:signal transduction histidine kinase